MSSLSSSRSSSSGSNNNNNNTPVSIESVPGLYVQTEFFSHAVEHDLYHDRKLFPKSVEQVVQEAAAYKASNKNKHLTRTGNPVFGFQAGTNMPTLLVKVCNGVVESGLHSDFIAPNYCLPWSYPDKGSFYYHYDSKYRWGETVVGVTLGCAGYMSFSPQNKKAKGNGPPFVGKRSLNADGLSVEIRYVGKSQDKWVVDVFLPPRTVYVMSGSSRVDWKHMVAHNNEKNRKLPANYNANLINPAFRDCTVRRTITLRSTKVFSDDVLQRLVQHFPKDARYAARLKAQSKFRPQHGYNEGAVSDDELQRMRQKAAQEVSLVHHANSQRTLFFTDQERGYFCQNAGKSCWPLEGVAVDLPLSSVGGVAFAAMGSRLGGVDGGDGDDPQLAMALRLSMEEANQKERAEKERERASGRPTALSLAAASSSSMGLLPPLSREELRAKRLAAFGMSSSSTKSTSSSPMARTGDNIGKRKLPPPKARSEKPLSDEHNVVNLLNDSSDDDEDGDGDEEMAKKPPAKKGKPTTVIYLDDDDE